LAREIFEWRKDASVEFFDRLSRAQPGREVVMGKGASAERNEIGMPASHHLLGS
jgi:hypothetical protein